jgi:hypothetical protein
MRSGARSTTLRDPGTLLPGYTVVAILRDTDNPNSVWICLDGDRERGEQFLPDPEVAKIMQAAGVVAPPDAFWVE